MCVGGGGGGCHCKKIVDGIQIYLSEHILFVYNGVFVFTFVWKWVSTVSGKG